MLTAAAVSSRQRSAAETFMSAGSGELGSECELGVSEPGSASLQLGWLCQPFIGSREGRSSRKDACLGRVMVKLRCRALLNVLSWRLAAGSFPGISRRKLWARAGQAPFPSSCPGHREEAGAQMGHHLPWECSEELSRGLGFSTREKSLRALHSRCV